MVVKATVEAPQSHVWPTGEEDKEMTLKSFSGMGLVVILRRIPGINKQ